MQRTLIMMLVLILLVGGYIVITNRRIDRAETRAATAESANATLTRQLSEANVKERVVTRYVDRVQVVRERGHVITKEVPIYVTREADDRCTVPVGFVRLHDAAAANLPPAEPAGNPDAPAPGVALSTVAETVAGNYTTCHATAEQLSALQAYLRELKTAGGG